MVASAASTCSLPDQGPRALDARQILRVLNRHDVRYVVVGWFAALDSTRTRTGDLDIVLRPDAPGQAVAQVGPSWRKSSRPATGWVTGRDNYAGTFGSDSA